MLLFEYLLWEVVAQRHVSESNVNVVLDYAPLEPLLFLPHF